ncbi:VanZ family protein [Streptomyces stelliscabiei]|uniref:VanZ family protein n=1 Tax=Streptomyces stelliscabiei TaxID=146820 RepID=UPI0029B7603E|nr:VanZ family protein [Streptomyces stelliscabiei]MDX2552451.1 VanZ family protein [Streptomyces stelliscabiei]MDX2611846.1 VanZ family protein [Streptomyces stelliscabiei]MDX2637193.1 VanZ family protein [Streptomyces stelliscabiei]MDX2660612.1 VanZ family protein [Streptomyces stelliscabiei]MDX2714926.1 VanZ family protein [Streptomyces stelliscabiei]
MAGTTSRSGSTTSGRRPPASPHDRRPLPLPLRLLAMALAFLAMVAFGAVLAGLTLQPSPASEALTHSNLTPGSSLELYWHHPDPRDALKQVGGNILLGVPFGFLLPVLAPGARGLLRVPALTAVVMLLVELVQGALVTGRAFDIDDVILNTTGALLGYLLLGQRLGRAVHARAPREPRTAPASRRAPARKTPARRTPRGAAWAQRLRVSRRRGSASAASK